MPIAYLPKVNQRTLGSELLIVNEAHIIGITGVATISTNYVRLIEVPLQEVPSTVIIPGFTEVTTTPGTNEFKVDYANGRIIFNAVQNGNTVYVTYKGRGSIVDGEDINEIQQVFVGSVTPGSPTIGIANLNGTLSTGIVRPNNISTILTDNFTFPNDIIVTGDTTINGDLDVKGAITYIESATVRIDDPIIQLNYNQVAQNSGIEVERGINPSVQLIWNESTTAWELENTSGSPILQAFDSGIVSIPGTLSLTGPILINPGTATNPAYSFIGDINTGIFHPTTKTVAITTNGTEAIRVDGNQNIGIGISPVAKLHNAGATVLGTTAVTDPGSITISQVDNYTGIVITTTGAVIVTMPTPTNTTSGRLFSVIHEETSTGTLNLNGKNVTVGQGSTFMWEGTTWAPVGGGSSGFNPIVGDPATPTTGEVWFDTTTNQFKGYNGTNNVILG